MGNKAFFQNRRGARASHRIEFLSEESSASPVSHPKRDHVNNVIRRREARALKVILEELRTSVEYTTSELIGVVRTKVSNLKTKRVESILKRLLCKEVLSEDAWGTLTLASNYIRRQFQDAFVFLQKKLFGRVVMVNP